MAYYLARLVIGADGANSVAVPIFAAFSYQCRAGENHSHGKEPRGAVAGFMARHSGLCNSVRIFMGVWSLSPEKLRMQQASEDGI